MIAKKVYGKTKRLSNRGEPFRYTEKLDGANLVFAKKNGKLHICQRNNIFTLEEIGLMKGKKYPESEFTKKWYMFAKANMDDEYNLYNIMYDHELFIFPFENDEALKKSQYA